MTDRRAVEEMIARTAQRVREGGVPDFLNVWLRMTPEQLEESEAARERLRQGRIEATRRWREPEVATKDEVDFTAHRHPCLAVACPDCGAAVGAWCKRPSGHRAGDLHAQRKQAADAAWEKSGLPLITQVGPGKFVYDPPAEPAQPATAEAAQQQESAMATKTAATKAAKKAPDKKTARRAPAKKAAARSPARGGDKPNWKPGTIGATAREAILAGKTNDEALAIVKEKHPGCETTAGNIAWYRNDLRSRDMLPKPKA